jgi:hypothetical protein
VDTDRLHTPSLPCPTLRGISLQRAHRHSMDLRAQP